MLINRKLRENPRPSVKPAMRRISEIVIERTCNDHNEHNVLALCNDGSTWLLVKNGDDRMGWSWRPLPNIPQDDYEDSRAKDRRITQELYEASKEVINKDRDKKFADAKKGLEEDGLKPGIMGII